MPAQPRECADAVISGDTPHLAQPGKRRCSWHEQQWDTFQATNRQRRLRKKAKLKWPERVTPRPTRVLPFELTRQQVDAIRSAVAEVATEKAPLDSLIGHGSDRFRAQDVTNLVSAVNGLLDSLREITRKI